MTRAVQAAAIRRRIRIPLRFADGYSTTATVVSFAGLTDAQQHVALELGRLAAAALPLVRLHSECLTGDVFGSQRCDCGAQLREAVERIANCGGYLLYLRQEGRGVYKGHAGQNLSVDVLVRPVLDDAGAEVLKETAAVPPPNPEADSDAQQQQQQQ